MWEGAMGLGPGGNSLLKRIGQAARTIDWLEMERMERGLTRRAAVIKWRGKSSHKKPLAPVANPSKDEKDGSRIWQWVGDTMESKGFVTNGWYSVGFIRKMGFKLPPVGGNKK
jgi:hypothetical protein